nr:type II toxin-antitoxin system HicA family toxin [Phyllobacterium bourgognense]
MRSADIIRELVKAGWILDRIRGSHHVFKHPDRPGHVVVPHPKKDLGMGLVRPSINRPACRRQICVIPSPLNRAPIPELSGL